MKLNLEDKLKIIKLKEDGFSETYIAKMFSVNRSTISTITRQYREHGIKSFKPKGKNVKYPPDFKMSVVKRVLLGESKSQIANEFALNVGTIFSWVSKYENFGYNGLITQQGRPKKMKPENKKAKQNTTHVDKKDRKIKELEEKNAQLEMENDLLKKLRALVLQRTQQPKKKK